MSSPSTRVLPPSSSSAIATKITIHTLDRRGRHNVLVQTVVPKGRGPFVMAEVEMRRRQMERVYERRSRIIRRVGSVALR
jgi:hypothetical protein